MDYPDPGDFLESDDYSVYENRYEDELEMMEENFKPKRNDNNNAKKGNIDFTVESTKSQAELDKGLMNDILNTKSGKKRSSSQIVYHSDEELLYSSDEEESKVKEAVLSVEPKKMKIEDAKKNLREEFANLKDQLMSNVADDEDFDEVAYQISRRRVFRRPIMGHDTLNVTNTEGDRVFLKLAADAENEKLNMSFRETNDKKGLNLLTIPFEDLLAEVVAKRHSQEMQRTSTAQRIPDLHETKAIALWADKYSPHKYTELLSDDGTNRLLLKWLKLWDNVVFQNGKNLNRKELDKRTMEMELKKKEARFNKGKDFKPTYATRQQLQEEDLVHDKKGRPKHKVALLCGNPGLGKTTLAHVISKHAGYNVIEMNARYHGSLVILPVMLLMSAKDVACALTELVGSTKNSSGKPSNDPAMETLKASAKTMVTSVSSLLKTVRSVEDEASRGVRAIESTVDAVKQAVLNLQIGEPEKKATPEDLIRATKGVTLATAKAVSAGNSGKQEDIVQAANIGRRYCTELLVVVKAAAFNAESESIRVATIVKGRDTAQAYCEVLDHVASVIVHPTPQKKQHLTVLSKKVAHSVGELVKSAEELKGADWVNPEDPNVIAENELLGAAASIEAAARKLAELKPRARPKAADESLNFEEQILEAAKSITVAAGALVKAATAAQRELVATGRDDPNSAGDDWSQSIIAAARLVAAATGSLCEAANAAIQGNCSEEKLVASAKAVSNSTAQLLLACKSRNDSASKTQNGLQTAGGAVKRAADALVKAAQGSAFFHDEIHINIMPSDDYNDEIEMQEMILKKQRELREAREKLKIIKEGRFRDDEGEEEE